MQVQRPAPSHAVAHATAGQAIAPGAQGSHRSPHAFPAHGSYGAGHTGGTVTQLPLASHVPRRDGARHGGTADRQGGSTVQASPQPLPAQASWAAQAKVPTARHAPAGSQAFATADSTQPGSPGAQTVHASPHAFPAQGA